MPKTLPGRSRRCGAQAGVSLNVGERLIAPRRAPDVVVVVERLGVELVGEDAGTVEALDLLLLGRQGAQMGLDNVDDDEVGGGDGAEPGVVIQYCEMSGLGIHSTSYLVQSQKLDSRENNMFCEISTHK